MAEFIYTTEAVLRGPWLVDGDKLEALDKVLDDEWERLAKRNQESISTKLDQRLNNIIERREENAVSKKEYQSLRKEIEEEIRGSYGYREERKITLFYQKEKRAEVASFQEAMRQPPLLEEVPVRFSAEIVCGEISCKISLDTYRGDLSISASPERVPEARELFAALHRWGTTNRPPKWQQVWRARNGIQWVIWYLLLAIGLVVVVASSRNPYKEQARELVRNGVSQENQQRAIELLLAIASEYQSPESNSQIFPTWLLILVFGGLIVCLITSFVPKSVLGIGKGQDRINHWRMWFRVVFYLVPSFIFLNIIWPLISGWIFPK